MDLRDAHIVAAVESSDAMHALLARFAELAGPGRGAPIVLAALARMGTSACDWLDGELRIELVAEGAKTRISVSSTLGGGFREKVFQDIMLDAPLAEFARGIQRAPRLVEPLSVKESDKRVVLTATPEVRKTSMPPPMVQIDPSSFVPVPKMTLPLGVPRDIDDAPAVPPSAAAHASDDKKVVLRKRVRTDRPK